MSGTQLAEIIERIPFLSPEDLEVLSDAVRNARAARGRALSINGSRVRLDGLAPKYLNGLEGVVVRREGRHVDVRLDAPNALELHYRSKGRRGSRDGSYDLRGVPVVALRPASV